MPVYHYKGVAAGNRSVKATIDAESLRAARTKLRADGIYPTQISEGRTQSEASDFLSKLELPALRGVPDLDLSLFSGQLATLLEAGVPLLQSLIALTDQVEHARLKSIVGKVRESVNEGATLADALHQFPYVFDELYVSMVRSGEQSGALAVVLRRLAAYVENRMTLRNKIVSAMIYPILMLGAAAIVTGVLMVYVIPTVKELLTDMDVELPLPTVIVMTCSDFLAQWWIHLTIAILAGVLGFNRFIQTNGGRLAWDRFKLRAPVLGRVSRYISISRFCRTLATLVTGGLPIVQALEISKKVAANRVIGDAVDAAKDAITRGSTIAAPLRQSGEFPPMVTHMVAVGEATGELDTMLAKVADTYDQLVDLALDRLMAVLGPALLLGVAVVVVFVILSTLLPMLSLTSNL